MKDPTYDYEGYDPIFTPFASPFDKYFAHGCRIFNWNHPVTQELVKLMGFLERAGTDPVIPSDKIGIIEDLIRSLRPSRENIANRMVMDHKNFMRQLENIFSLKQELKSSDAPKGKLLTDKDFVQHTLQIKKGKKKIISKTEISLRQVKKNFGLVIVT